MAPKLRLAISPSLQDTNAFTDWDGDRTTEMAQMGTFATQLQGYLAQRFPTTLEVKVFPGSPYSHDTYHLQGLHEQQKRVRAYLDAAAAAGIPDTVSLNCHTDSGSTSHVGGYWDGRSAGSESLAKALRDAIAPVFGTTVKMGVDYGAQEYVFALEMRSPVNSPTGTGRHRANLQEIGSHQNKHDEEVIQTRWLEIAGAWGDVLQATFSLVEPPMPDGSDWPGLSPDLAAYCEGRPELGHLLTRDLAGYELALLMSGDRHVSLVARRGYTQECGAITFQKVRP